MRQFWIEAFEELYTGDPWYGINFTSFIESVEAEKLNVPIKENGHTSGQIIEHIIAWRGVVTAKLNGDYSYRITIDSTKDWPQKSYQIKDWPALKKAFLDSQDQLLQALKQKDDRFLDSLIPGSDYDHHYLLRGVYQHDLYHLGQISISRR